MNFLIFCSDRNSFCSFEFGGGKGDVGLDKIVEKAPGAEGGFQVSRDCGDQCVAGETVGLRLGDTFSQSDEIVAEVGDVTGRGDAAMARDECRTRMIGEKPVECLDPRPARRVD